MDPITCTCGAILVEEITKTGVRPVGAAEPIVFRRTTDYVVCPSCLTSYGVRDLMKRARSADSVTRLLALIPGEGEEPDGDS
ncbi:MAG TPA: hypothetical protein VGB83_08150 [Actinomycetota bacterium]